MTARRVLHRRSPAAALDVRGRDRIAFLQGLATNDFRTLSPGAALWSAALSPVGKVLFTFRAAPREEAIRLLLDPARRERASSHFRKYAVFQDVRIEETAPLVRFDFYGEEPPAAPGDADAWPAFFELTATWLVPAASADAVEEALGPAVIGEEEAEARRIAAGRPADGLEIDETRTPDEAGLAAAVSAAKGCYVGQEVVARMRTYGRAPRRLVRFVFEDRPARGGTALVRPGDPSREVGRVTSSAGAAGLGWAGRDVADGETLAAADAPETTARVFPIAP